MTLETTQGLGQPSRGVDQPLDKNIPITQTCQDGSPPVIGTQTSAKEKKIVEPKDRTTTLFPSHHTTPVSSPHTSPITSPHASLVPSSHATPIPSPHHSPIPLLSATLLKLSGSPIQIVDLGDGKSSSSESTKFDEATKKTQDVDKGQSSSKIISWDPKNPFFSTIMIVNLAIKKIFSIESLGSASKVIGTNSWLEDILERKRKRKDESSPTKDTISLVVCYRSTWTKVKKQKNLSILGKDLEIGHLTMEIAKPKKEGRIEDMKYYDFTLHSVDLGEARHDTKVMLWKSTNQVIKG